MILTINGQLPHIKAEKDCNWRGGAVEIRKNRWKKCRAVCYNRQDGDRQSALPRVSEAEWRLHYMKLLSAQGHFGTMDGRRIQFGDGLNVLYLPNEGGKTTLCDFIRIMLYGLNTSKRDGRQQLADKNRYKPVDGCSMSGVLELEWRGRQIRISRQTGTGGPMQEFSAVYMDTGEECEQLTSRECGEVLTGVGEEGFRSSAMVDGANQAVSAQELSDKILALSTTGDSAMIYSNAMTQLDKWRSELKSGSRGRLAEVESERSETEARLAHLDELKAEIDSYQQQLPVAEQRVERQKQSYTETYEGFMQLFAGTREAAERDERNARKIAAEAREKLPDLKLLAEADKAIKKYYTAVELEKEAREDSADIKENYETYRDEIDKTEEEYGKNDGTLSDIHVRVWALLIGVVFVLLAGASAFHLLPVSGLVQTLLPYLFSFLAAVFVIVAFMGSNKTMGGPPMDFEEERKKLKRRRIMADGRPEKMSEKTKLAWKNVVEAAQRLGIDSEDEDTIVGLIAEKIELREDFLDKNQRHQELSERYLEILEKTGPDGEERVRVRQAQQELDKAQSALEELKQNIAICQGQCKEIGTRDELEEKRCRLSDEREDILFNLDAIKEARESLIRVNAELTGRMAPQINQLAQKYLAILTNNKYTALQMYTNFEAVCRQENSAVELDKLRLSTGTRDQLYLALRLAACMVLLDNSFDKVPLVLDDPFLTYDEERSACAMSLMRYLAYDRQIVLLTCRKPK